MSDEELHSVPDDEISRMRYGYEYRPKAAAAPNRAKKPSGKKGRKGKFVILGLLFIFLAGVIFFYRAYFTSRYWTVAVYGVDSRDGNVKRGALSDVIMVASVDKQTGAVRMISVFRDSFLDIGDGKLDKINEAYFLGGNEQATAALENNLDIKIDDYATFNWKAVAEGINMLGGVDIEISDKEFAYINSFITETVESTGIGSVHLKSAGANHLDGVQAVAYARLRLMDTDFNRTARQRKVLGQAFEKAKAADIGLLKDLAKNTLAQISTDIGFNDLLPLLLNIDKYYFEDTSGFPFAHTEMNIDGRSCVVPATLSSNVISLHEFLYPGTPYSLSDSVKDIGQKISEATGVSEEGRDTETGRVDVSSSSAEQSKTPASQPVTETAAESPAEETLSEAESQAQEAEVQEETDVSEMSDEISESSEEADADRDEGNASENPDAAMSYGPGGPASSEASEDDYGKKNVIEAGGSAAADTSIPQAPVQEDATSAPAPTQEPGTEDIVSLEAP